MTSSWWQGLHCKEEARGELSKGGLVGGVHSFFSVENHFLRKI